MKALFPENRCPGCFSFNFGLSFQIKHATGVKCWKTCGRSKALTETVVSAAKHAIGAGKARENTQPGFSARKRAGGGKRGKACGRLNAGKYATGVERGKNVQPVLGA